MSEPTFADVERLLLQLGFRAHVVSDSHVLFEHAGAGSRVVLRPYDADEPMEPAALAYVRRTLDEWGILERERFDEELKRRSLAS